MIEAKSSYLPILFLFTGIVVSLAGFQFHKESEPKITILEKSRKGALSIGVELPGQVNETSGLLYQNGLLLTHNDKGGEPALFVLDTLGKFVNKIAIKGVYNDDWEDLAQNEKFIFIGNFGNNEGDRKNLQIIKIAKAGLDLRKSSVASPVELISFHYPEQKDFNPGKSHNFDCEAFICLKDKLYLFTKNRAEKGCSLYQLSISGQNQAARKLGDFETPGRITGADLSPDGSKICLIGYNKKKNCFLVFLENFQAPKFFEKQKSETDLGDYFKVGQLEGVGYKTNFSLFLTAEKTKKQPPQLYRFTK